MTSEAIAPGFAAAAVFAVAGLVFGRVYFAALRRSVERYAAGGGRLVPAGLTLARLAGALLFLGLAARVGALPLLAAFLGFLLARSLALGMAGRKP